MKRRTGFKKQAKYPNLAKILSRFPSNQTHSVLRILAKGEIK